jgi:hypothetical protein
MAGATCDLFRIFLFCNVKLGNTKTKQKISAKGIWFYYMNQIQFTLFSSNVEYDISMCNLYMNLPHCYLSICMFFLWMQTEVNCHAVCLDFCLNFIRN